MGDNLPQSDEPEIIKTTESTIIMFFAIEVKPMHALETQTVADAMADVRVDLAAALRLAVYYDLREGIECIRVPHANS